MGDERYLNLQIGLIYNSNGIYPSDLDKVFVDFNKLSENQNREGLELGLAVSKKTVELMGGSVTVQSEVSLGTCFNINLTVKCKVLSTKIERNFVSHYLG